MDWQSITAAGIVTITLVVFFLRLARGGKKSGCGRACGCGKNTR